jgi:hypothetical protein
LIRISKENAEKVFRALLEFGFPSSEVHVEDFLEAAQVIQIGRRPYRIDILTSIDGVTWMKRGSRGRKFSLDRNGVGRLAATC